MQEVKAAPAAYGAPTSPKEQYIQQTPLWVLVVRVLQIVFALVILAMCGYLMHGKALEANVFALVVCLMTWIVAGYALVTEKVTSANGAYNIWAILGLDLLMSIFWLSSMGANAALRASFKHTVTVEACYNDGSLVNSNTCVVSKRLMRRADGPAVAGPVALAVMSAVAGLSALMLIFHLATLIFHGHNFRLHHAATKGASDNGKVEMNVQPPVVQQQQQQQQQPQQGYGYPAGYPQQGQGQPQPYPQGFPQQQYPQTVPSPAPPVSTPSPAPYHPSPVSYQTPPAPGQAPGAPTYELPHGQPGPYQMPGSESQPYAYQNQQQPYNPAGTPTPGQPYYPPQQ